MHSCWLVKTKRFDFIFYTFSISRVKSLLWSDLIAGAEYELVSGVAGHWTGLNCDISPGLSDDHLLLILWYKIGQQSPIYTWVHNWVSQFSVNWIDIKSYPFVAWQSSCKMSPRANSNHWIKWELSNFCIAASPRGVDKIYFLFPKAALVSWNDAFFHQKCSSWRIKQKQDLLALSFSKDQVWNYLINIFWKIVYNFYKEIYNH